MHAQELENEKIKASVQAKLFGGQQAVQKKESEIEALQAEHLQAQVGASTAFRKLPAVM